MSERSDPLRTMYREAEAAFTTFPPPDSVFADADGAVDTVSGFGDPDAERRAVREGGALLDFSWKRIIRVIGDDRMEFLNRMLTQELKGLRPGQAVHAFWLNRKGRIEADLRLIHLERETLLEVDAPVIERTLESLQSFIIVEDVEMSETSNRWRTLALTGPRSLEWIRAAGGEGLDDMTSGTVLSARIADIDALIDRDDEIGAGGIRLLIPESRLMDAHRHLTEVGAALNGDGDHPCRMAGWDAYNSDRVSSAHPLFLVDFGTTSLPHESGALKSRVSFTKGCFLGQEVVARMQSLGQPKQKCVALRIECEELPGPGAKLHPAESPDTDAIGVITSAATTRDDSTIAAIAQLKTRYAVVGDSFQLSDGSRATIQAVPGF